MKTRAWMVALGAGFSAALIAACGSVAVEKSSSNASASGSTTGAGGASVAGASSGGGESGFGGFGVATVGAGGAGGSPAMPGFFDCEGCLCDGATHFCAIYNGLKSPPPGPPPEPMCPDDGGASSCKPIPPACLPQATCQCVNPQMGACQCEVLPEGLVTTCYVP